MAAKYLNGKPTPNGNLSENCCHQQQQPRPAAEDIVPQPSGRGKVQELRQQYQQLQQQQMLKQQQMKSHPKSRPRVHFKEDVHQKHYHHQQSEQQQQHIGGLEESRSSSVERHRYSSKTLLKSQSMDGGSNNNTICTTHTQEQQQTGSATSGAGNKAKRRRGIHRSYSEVGDSSTALRCRAILRSHSVFLEVRHVWR
ncbi:hypothetical protein RRG08_002662 [Elysia crispata]|uniref:Uncharacterized protein n=1 Tax=Elysia crispata TaxID=231223 RepID=A0AAE1CLY8_9GAST|nr:hypothetical protein RRG08_002662 [Elysia crispata]